MDKKEAFRILGVSEDASRNEIERKYAILLKKHKMHLSQDSAENTAERTDMQAGVTQKAADSAEGTREKEEFSFDQVTEAYNTLMGYEVTIKEKPPSKIAPILKKAGIDEKKAENFFYYYKFHIIAVIALIIAAIFTIKSFVNRVEPDFNIAFIGRIGYIDAIDALKKNIKENVPEIAEPGIDGAFLADDAPGEQQYAMEMKAVTLFAAGEVDVFILDKTNFEKYAKQGAFKSLDDIAPSIGADMESNKEFIVKVEEDEGDQDGGNQAVTDPNEHLFGIDVSQSKVLRDAGVIGDELVAAIFTGCEQDEKAEKFLQLLIK